MTEEIRELDNVSVVAPTPTGTRPLGRRRVPSPWADRAHDLAASLADQPSWAVQVSRCLQKGLAPESWAHYVQGVMDLILDAARALRKLEDHNQFDNFERATCSAKGHLLGQGPLGG
ncbi:hypothetical protein ACWIB8_03670 [Corynebacterium flavescens]